MWFSQIIPIIIDPQCINFCGVIILYKAAFGAIEVANTAYHGGGEQIIIGFGLGYSQHMTLRW